MKGRLDFLATGFGSLCCIVPLLLLGVGLGGTMLPMFFVSYKVPFMTVAVTALGLAWYLYLRDRRRCLTEGCVLVGSRWRGWVLGGNTLAVAIFMLISLTPLGVVAGNALFPPPDLGALTAQPPPSLAAPIAGKSGGLLAVPLGSRAGAGASGTGAARRKVARADAAVPGTGMAMTNRIALRVEGMS